jgi:hypothetical protein
MGPSASGAISRPPKKKSRGQARYYEVKERPSPTTLQEEAEDEDEREDLELAMALSLSLAGPEKE